MDRPWVYRSLLLISASAQSGYILRLVSWCYLLTSHAHHIRSRALKVFLKNSCSSNSIIRFDTCSQRITLVSCNQLKEVSVADLALIIAYVGPGDRYNKEFFYFPSSLYYIHIFISSMEIHYFKWSYTPDASSYMCDLDEVTLSLRWNRISKA